MGGQAYAVAKSRYVLFSSLLDFFLCKAEIRLNVDDVFTLCVFPHFASEGVTLTGDFYTVEVSSMDMCNPAFLLRGTARLQYYLSIWQWT